ncbi:hypothetical protein PVAND_008067 [Polypedilum vanderplanki]|uniref:Uncharacterized protein n=1 Tax=Polypedilum vanderplanki TaxID=319348 RepID=A0A9J6C9E3_POLVA|nr:hypothetical protein PVAND_008067 [Polypedilum vanderplanki]
MKLIIIAITLIISVVSCQQKGGWIKGPDGYKYFTPEERMQLPNNLERIYIPPLNLAVDVTNEPLGLQEFPPFFGPLTDVEATTFEYEYVH